MAHDDVEAPGPSGFAELGLRAEVLAELSRLGYEEPTPIQRAAIPPLLEGRDLMGQAATGTGKTAAFALPIVHDLTAGRGDDPQALVLVPTRELAVQVSEAVHRYGRGRGARVVPVYGGQPIGRQLGAFERGVDVVVATPGRALDHLRRGTLRTGALRTVVLDEADEMLDMGFADDIEAILERIPPQRQTVLFSATLPPRIDTLARRHLRQAVQVRLDEGPPAAGGVPLVTQRAYVVPRAHKPAALGRILDVEVPGSSLVFCRTRLEVDQLAETLNGRGYRAEALHGGMSQEQRDRVMGRLRAGTADLLVATDVAARGLDVEHLTHVVNYDVPAAADTYLHRIGRVGRAGREGVAITVAEPRERRLLQNIERLVGQRIPVERMPTVADLQARRMELLGSALRETLADGDHDRYRVVVESLAQDFDLADVAAAALRLAHDASGPGDEGEEIPEASFAPERSRPTGRAGGGRPEPRGGGEGRTVRLFVGLGRNAGVRPQDLVGAITGEAGLAGRDVGAIQIADRFSLVEVPEARADEVIDALNGRPLRGRRLTVRRERYDQGGRPDPDRRQPRRPRRG
jgi:ATP-dependent RNA helicase DeaD